MQIKGQSPTPAEHGTFLHEDSVSGKRVEFFKESTTATSTFTVDALGLYYLSFSLRLYPPGLPRSARTSENIIATNKSIAWPVVNFFVDTYDGDHYIGNTNSLTAGQSLVRAYYFNEFSPIDGYTQTSLITIENDDSSSHTIYFEGIFKYVLTN